MIVGPADPSRFRVKVGRYNDRWYRDDLPSCQYAEYNPEWQAPSFSIVKKASGKDWTPTALHRVAADIVNEPYKYNKVKGDADGLYARMSWANDHGLNVASGRGTIIHWWMEDALAGKPFRMVFEWDLVANNIPFESLTAALLYQPAIGDFFDTYQPELVVSEVVAIDRTLNGVGYGCTGDAGIRIEGELVAADWKTRSIGSKPACYPEEGAQVGGSFASAQYMIVERDGVAVREALPKFDHGLIVSITPEACRLYPIDIEKGRKHFEAMHAWWVARRTERSSVNRILPYKSLSNRLTDSASSATVVDLEKEAS